MAKWCPLVLAPGPFLMMPNISLGFLAASALEANDCRHLSTMTPRSLSRAAANRVTLNVTQICFRRFFPPCTTLRLLTLKLTCHFFAHTLNLGRRFWSALLLGWHSTTGIICRLWHLTVHHVLKVLNSWWSEFMEMTRIHVTYLILFLKDLFFPHLWRVTELPL